MVLGMSCYNLLLQNAFSFPTLLKGLLPGFIVAFLLDTLVVGKIAKYIAFKLPIKHEKPFYLIVTISCLMILGMVTFMSAFGLLMNSSSLTIFPTLYPHAWIMNFIVALPYQLLIVGPVSRKILKQIQQKATA